LAHVEKCFRAAADAGASLRNPKETKSEGSNKITLA